MLCLGDRQANGRWIGGCSLRSFGKRIERHASIFVSRHPVNVRAARGGRAAHRGARRRPSPGRCDNAGSDAADAANRRLWPSAATNPRVLAAFPTTLTNQSDSTRFVTFRNGTFDGALSRQIPVGGSFRVGVGGTIDIVANQAPGLYLAPFTVTADYQ